MDSIVQTQTSFVGRSHEIKEISDLLDNPACRLLTLSGPGGMGKTRLATEIAVQTQAMFPDGVFFVSLAPLNPIDDPLTAIIEAMPFIVQQDDRPARKQFFDYLREKSEKYFLLVLDNFEHLLAHISIISDMLAATTHLKIIVTSREALNLQEEWVRQVEGLSYPHQENGNGRSIEDYSAVRLFVERARRIRGDFNLASDGDSVVEICRLVGGMPLAIELAVGWLKTLQPADIVREIRQSMDILETRSRNLPERHRSIRSVFSHSWRLIDEDERDVFKKLTLFRGGFTREAAEVVAGASLYTLAGLVDKSLVRLGAGGRYDIHELLRQFGAEQMDGAQTEQVQHAYVDYFLGMMAHLEAGIKAHHQIESLDRIQADFENVRHAWVLAQAQGNYECLSQAVESLHFFADMRGRYHEVVMLLSATIDRFPATLTPEQNIALHRIYARLIRLVLLGNLRIDFDMRARIENCLTLAYQNDDQAEVGFCLIVMGLVDVLEGDKTTERFSESSVIYEALNDPFYVAEARVWMGVGCLHWHEESFEMSFRLRREIGDRNGIAWITLAQIEIMLSDLNYIEAEQSARQAVALMREIGSLKGVLQAQFKLVQLLILKGNVEEAHRLILEMRALADETNNLDGKMLSTGLFAFVISVMDENYTEAMLESQKNKRIAQERFFGWNDIAARWGGALAACGLGDYDFARQEYPALVWERYDDPGPATICLALEAAGLAYDGNLEEATEFLSLAFSQPLWSSGWLHRWHLLTRLQDDLKQKLGAEQFAHCWQRGAERDLVTTMERIFNERQQRQPVQPTANQALIEPLSERELEVLGLIVDGLSNRDIAERLVVSVGTVKVHARNIYGKLNVNSRTQAIAQASRYNLLGFQ